MRGHGGLGLASPLGGSREAEANCATWEGKAGRKLRLGVR